MEIKLLKDQSVIIYPPKELVTEWIVRIDIIRYNLQLIEYFYDTLLSKVNDILNNKLTNNIIILNDAWSIIENTHILFKFISNEIKEYENVNADLFDNMRLIRNTKQHLDSRIDEFDLSNHPFLGYFTFAEIIGDNVKVYLLLGGYSMKNLNMELPVNSGESDQYILV